MPRSVGWQIKPARATPVKALARGPRGRPPHNVVGGTPPGSPRPPQPAYAAGTAEITTIAWAMGYSSLSVTSTWAFMP